jgi:hypothetical protein
MFENLDPEQKAVLITAILAIAKIITNLTPTEKDDNIVDWIDKIVDFFIPNNKKGGGTHKRSLWNIFKKRKK